jgi:hypothetical protein
LKSILLSRKASKILFPFSETFSQFIPHVTRGSFILQEKSLTCCHNDETVTEPQQCSTLSLLLMLQRSAGVSQAVLLILAGLACGTGTGCQLVKAGLG